MIYGERIRLVAIEREDLLLFVKWFNDPEVREGLAMYLPMSLAQEEKWFEEMLTRDPNAQPLNIEARQDDDWVKIGNMGLFDFDHRARSAELGISIGNKDFWNQGYGTEAITLLLRHGFETLNLNRIMLQVYADNPRAIRCYEKAGFVYEGRLRQARYHNGQYYDILNMGILKEEWALGRDVNA
ncbi:MAG: GNAT family N-acetyltransferase [Anaerolineales bacterium]|nr:GNAT family N-acetyltransferase [Anaerolineales bacterium]